MNLSNEYNTTIVNKIVMLMEEIALFESRFEEQNTGNLKTTVSVLRKRVKELKERIHD